MSKCFPVVCGRCGRLIEHVYKAYTYLKRQIMEKNEYHIENASFDKVNQDLKGLCELFGITSNCCKIHFLSAVLPQDLEMIGDYKNINLPY